MMTQGQRFFQAAGFFCHSVDGTEAPTSLVGCLWMSREPSFLVGFPGKVHAAYGTSPKKFRCFSIQDWGWFSNLSVGFFWVIFSKLGPGLFGIRGREKLRLIAHGN